MGAKKAILNLLNADPDGLASRRFRKKAKRERRKTPTERTVQNLEDPKQCSLIKDTDQGADVGILNCGEGYICIASEESRLGGACKPDPSISQFSRHLQTIETCNPNNPDEFFTDPLTCDCTGINLDSRTGSFSCTEIDTDLFNTFPECSNLRGDLLYDYTFENDYLSKGSVCYTIKEPVSESACFSYDYTVYPPACSIEFNGQPCQSCEFVDEDFYKIDCRNVEKGPYGIANDINITAVLLRSVGECYNPCEALCEDGSEISSARSLTYGGETFTCDEFVYTALTYAFDCDRVVIPTVSSFCCGTDPPTPSPTAKPTARPTTKPTDRPTIAPSLRPSAPPTKQFTPNPTETPNSMPAQTLTTTEPTETIATNAPSVAPFTEEVASPQPSESSPEPTARLASSPPSLQAMLPQATSAPSQILVVIQDPASEPVAETIGGIPSTIVDLQPFAPPSVEALTATPAPHSFSSPSASPLLNGIGLSSQLAISLVLFLLAKA